MGLRRLLRYFESDLHVPGRPFHGAAALRAADWKLVAIAAPIVAFSALGCGGRSASPGSIGDGGALDTVDTGHAPAENLSASVGCGKQLASGDDHSCILYADGRVACVGGGGFGQLGNGSTADAPGPVPVDGVASARLLAAGGHHTCAISEAGLQCWGDNRSSELGVAGMDQSALPVSVALPNAQGPIQIALGARHACVLDLWVHGYCWGTGAADLTMVAAQQIPAIGEQPLEILQLGGSATRLIDKAHLYDVPWRTDSRNVDAIAGVPDGIIANAIGDDHDCVLKAGGTVWCRGAGYPDFYAVVADFGRDVAEIAVGKDFTCARTGDGQVLCRGRNDSGQLGDGTLATRDIAVMVPGIGPAVELSLGSAHACARVVDGSVWCWGAMGGSEIRRTPERIAGPAPSQTCDDVTSVPRPWSLPIPSATAADKLMDAVTAWAQNQCRCAFSDVNALPGCIREETPVLNGCLAALGVGSETQALCVAESAWRSAACAAKCADSASASGAAECADSFVASCGAGTSGMAFCMRRTLPCDESNSALVQHFQTCDGKMDCPNGFDEANCRPESTAFHCADGFSSIGLDLVRNGKPDCPDGSDEW